MSSFVDASVLVAIVGREAGWESYADLVDGEVELIWSAMSRWEAVVALRRNRQWTFEQARDAVDDFGQENGLKMLAIDKAEADLALRAAADYGRGSGHRAQLNMGDCFAYACAKANGARLFYKGDDFAHTDLA